MAYEPASLPSLSLVGGFSAPGGFVNPVLVAEAGAYALSGQTTQAFKGRRVTADSGTYTIAGQTAYADYHVVAVGGTYTLSGIVAGLTASHRKIAANTGSYALTGQAVSLVAVDRILTLIAEAGTYALTTFSVDLIVPATLTGTKVKLRTFVYSGPATATSVVSFDAQPVSSASTPDVFFLEGTADSEDVSGYASGTGTLFYTVSTGSLGAGVNLATNGLLTYDGTGAPSVSRISIRSDAVQAGTRFAFAEIPEIVFIEGIAETEELGVYQLDPDNPWTPGDLTNVGGWTATTPCGLKSNATGVSDTWLTYSQDTGRLTYSGAAITGVSRDYTVYLDSGSQQSATFRIRILRPSHVYGFGTTPGDVIAQHAWAGALAIDAATVPWSGTGSGSGPCRQGTKGLTDSDPRVIFMCGQDFPHQSSGWAMSPNTTAVPSDTTYCYVLGDPDRRPYLSKVGGVIGILSIRAISTLWYVKNLDLDRVSIYELSLTSDRKKNTYIHKVRQVGCDSDTDCLGSSFTYVPFPYPSDDRIDATDGSLGTYFHTYYTFVEGIGNGSTGGANHQMYIEGNGRAEAYINASLFAGARGCSTIKSIQTALKVRNSLLSVAPDYDTFASASDTAVPWAAELIDVKGTALYVDHNNEYRVGVSGSKGSRRAMFFRRRGTAMGGDVPPYPEANWNPPVGGSGHTPIPGFAQGAATFADDAFWAAVAATDVTSPDNPYTFKRYVSNSKFRLMLGTSGPVMRDDGLHPSEPAPAQFSPSVILGTHLNWRERTVSFFANNQMIGYQSTMPERYDLDNSDAVDGRIEDGTGNIASSFFVTWNDGTQGYVRVNYINNRAVSWSASLNAKFTAMGATSLNPPLWTDVQANLTAQVAQPLYPPAKWPRSAPEHFPRAVEVGGISFDDVPASPVDLPGWFQI